MKVLITGATGLVGSALVKKLLDLGYEVNYLTTSIQKINSISNCKGFLWNPDIGELDAACLDRVEGIVHLAGATIAKRWTKSYKQEILSSRVEGAHLLFQAMSKQSHQVKQFISASGIAAYPNSKTQVFTEEYEGYDSSFLGNVVKEWEQSAFQFEKLGLKVACLRTGVVFSEKGGVLETMSKPIKLGFGAVLGTGDQMMSWVALEDLVSMYEFVIKNQMEGIINAVAPTPISNKDLTLALVKKYNQKIWLPNAPEIVLRFFLGEMSELLFEDKKCYPFRIQQKGYIFIKNMF